MHYLSLAEVLELHRQIIEQSGGARGIRDLRSQTEQRYDCFGAVEGGILTVRFTYRRGIIHIFGADSGGKASKSMSAKITYTNEPLGDLSDDAGRLISGHEGL
jgi:hypothetical protein